MAEKTDSETTVPTADGMTARDRSAETIRAAGDLIQQLRGIVQSDGTERDNGSAERPDVAQVRAIMEELAALKAQAKQALDTASEMQQASSQLERELAAARQELATAKLANRLGIPEKAAKIVLEDLGDAADDSEALEKYRQAPENAWLFAGASQGGQPPGNQPPPGGPRGAQSVPLPGEARVMREIQDPATRPARRTMLQKWLTWTRPDHPGALRR